MMEQMELMAMMALMLIRVHRLGLQKLHSHVHVVLLESQDQKVHVENEVFVAHVADQVVLETTGIPDSRETSELQECQEQMESSVREV